MWGTVTRSTDREGDEQIDRHELQLIHRSNRVAGFWNRLRTWISRDGRAFRCGGRTRYQVETRFLVAGVPTAEGAEIRQIAPLPARNRRSACEALKTPSYSACTLVRQGKRLRASCDGENLTLDLRLGEPIPLALAMGQRGSVTGVWTWHHRSADSQGDRKVEDEVWHLLQRGDRIEGYYDRRVLVRSGDGRRFRCNNRLSYHNVARFKVKGRIVSGKVHLEETGFTARPGACETRKRVLDAYRGLLAPDGSMIHLSWKMGAQLLYRRY